MSTFINTSETTNHRDFIWPYPRSLILIPRQPPKNNGSKLYLTRPGVDECNCNVHCYETDFSRYKKLAKEESMLRNDIIKVNHEMGVLLSEMLDNSYKPEEKILRSVYQIAHEQSGGQMVEYRSLIAALDSPIESFRMPAVRDLKDSYRNPDRFPYDDRDTPHIDPAEAVDLARVPEVFHSSNRPFVGRSEYMDTINKLGMTNLKNHNQYLEPMPSSRRRKGNRNL